MSVADVDALLPQRPGALSSEEEPSAQTPSDQLVWRASLAVTLLGLGLIALMLVLSVLSPSSAGWVAVFGASFVFGSTGIPMKVPSLSHVSELTSPLLLLV